MISVPFFKKKGRTQEWIILEYQGEFVLQNDVVQTHISRIVSPDLLGHLEGKEFGSLSFLGEGSYRMRISNMVFNGDEIELPQPVGIFKKSKEKDGWKLEGIARKKVIFKKRPEFIMSDYTADYMRRLNR